MTEVNLGAPGGTSGHLAPTGHLALPPGHTSLRVQGGPGSRRTDTGTLDFEHLVRGCARFQGLCVGWLPHLSHCPFFQDAFF